MRHKSLVTQWTRRGRINKCRRYESDGARLAPTGGRNPLQRQRATTEEEAAGPLIAAKDLERYFAHISPWWLNLDDINKDTVRLAIFSLNPSTDTTIESDFISRFSALEGLVKRWTPIKAKFFKQKAEALLHAFPPRVIGLWPLVDNSSGKSLYWIRNELAHGRDVMQFTNGALALANDHLQLWLEYILLTIADYPHESHWKDWLSNEVISQREMVREISAKLEGQANGKQI
ncbi:hypothetical protein [Pseudomonas sp. DSP3-2-2]|uniref:hypothetical protein n=1 Tax=unclassified Pseudomonas TaxID=196821 RepID=UPI003CF415FF